MRSQFSLRSMLVAMVIAAMAAWVMYLATKGSPWARGATFGIVALVALVLSQVVIFALGNGLAQVVKIAIGDGAEVKTQNPFATATPPPRPLPAEAE